MHAGDAEADAGTGGCAGGGCSRRRARRSASVRRSGVGHSPAMKSRTSTRAPGRSAVSPPWRVSHAPGHVAVLLPGEQDRVRDRSRLASPPGWISKWRCGGVGSASPVLPMKPSTVPGLDRAAVHGVGGEGGEVGVEERVARLGVQPQAVAGDRQRADAVDGAVGDRERRARRTAAKMSLPSWTPVSARAAPKSSADVGLAVDGEGVALAGEALRHLGRALALGLLLRVASPAWRSRWRPAWRSGWRRRRRRRRRPRRRRGPSCRRAASPWACARISVSAAVPRLTVTLLPSESEVGAVACGRRRRGGPRA